MKKSVLFGLIIILIGGFLVRQYKIDNPIADWHSWRQADTSAVTRNYVKHGINLLYPRYDDFTDVSGKGLYNPDGYRFVEFPIFNLIHYTIYSLGSLIPSQPYDWFHGLLTPPPPDTQAEIRSVQAPHPLYVKAVNLVDFLFWLVFENKTLEFWGRFTSVLASLISAILIFFIVRRHFSDSVGLFAAFFYLFLPFNIYFTRVILPDPLMVTLFLATLNFFDLWTKSKNNLHFVLTCIFGAMAVLVKPVALFFLFPVTWHFLRQYGLKMFKSPTFYILHLSFILPFTAWRFWSHRYPQGIPASTWLLNGNKIRFKGAFFQWIFGERIGAIILGKWGIFPFLTGFISTSSFLVPWIIGSLLYLFTFATGNVQHDYYQLPIIPSIAILLALGTNQLLNVQNSFSNLLVKRGVLIVSIFFMLAFSWYTIRGNFQVNHWEIVEAGKAVDRLTPADSVVVAPYLGDTAFLYQTNRPGFPFMYMPIKDMIDRYSADYYVSVNYDDETRRIMEKYIVIEQTPQYVVVKLEEPIRP